jgi:hypothetical protein
MSKVIQNISGGARSYQSGGHSKFVSKSLFVAVLFAVFAAGCKKEESAPAPAPDLSSTSMPATDAAAVIDVDAPTLNLRTAANFTILAETGISTTGTTSVTGNMGVSPIAATAITGFGLTMDSGNQFSTSPIVLGKVFASNYTNPTPSKMTTAIADMKTAYNAANGRSFPPPVTEKYAGNISGHTLPPGLYKWGTGVLITGVGVTLKGAADDVWVFQIAQNLTVENGAIMTLAGGAQPRHIFWVVAGKATLGTGVNFKGNILSKTLISVKAGSRVRGRLLAQTAVTLIADTILPN